ncbi:MAG: flavodoxin family protein [Acidobacteria bacterium]|nr:flavodoxin family protein [Acidobacteriota bacterium]
MKVLIVYDSLFGNTEKVANAIKEGIGKKDTKVIKVKDAGLEMLEGIDLLIVGSPVHGGKPSADMKKFLSSIPSGSLKGCKAAAFDTGIPKEGQGRFVKFILGVFGYAAKGIASTLKQKGAQILDAETFFVLDKEGPLKEGELDRAKTWAKELIE